MAGDAAMTFEAGTEADSVLELHSPGDAEIEGDANSGSRRVKNGVYRKKYEEYVAVYGKQVRTIKWWVAQGKAVAGGVDLPPLDSPVEMPEWWARVMTQSCPKSILDAARAAAKPQAGVQGVERPVPAPAMKRAVEFEPPVITSQEENLTHLKGQLARVRLELLEAQTAVPVDQALIETKERKWRELRTEVDEAEAAVFKLKKLRGNLVDLEAVEAALMPKLATLADTMRATYVRLKPILATAKNDQEQDMIWQKGIDEAFEDLIRDGFMRREHLALSS
jgi:hypothetical protein